MTEDEALKIIEQPASFTLEDICTAIVVMSSDGPDEKGHELADALMAALCEALYSRWIVAAELGKQAAVEKALSAYDTMEAWYA